MKIFVDSDVVISSLISSSGAAYYLLHDDKIKATISSISEKEIRAVSERLNISKKKLDTLIKKRLNITELNRINSKYPKYVNDTGDIHIIAAAHKAGLKFLITYNLKHFKKDKINKELKIIVMTPAIFLQYLRSM